MCLICEISISREGITLVILEIRCKLTSSASLIVVDKIPQVFWVYVEPSVVIVAQLLLVESITAFAKFAVIKMAWDPESMSAHNLIGLPLPFRIETTTVERSTVSF